MIYDREKMQVQGDGFSITLVARHIGDAIIPTFHYRDDKVDFYFHAERVKWVRLPTNDRPGERLDTETYRIGRMWCENISCVEQKTNIPEDVREAARSNVLTGLLLMEEYCRKPPKKVVISSE